MVYSRRGRFECRECSALKQEAFSNQNIPYLKTGLWRYLLLLANLLDFEEPGPEQAIIRSHKEPSW